MFNRSLTEEDIYKGVALTHLDDKSLEAVAELLERTNALSDELDVVDLRTNPLSFANLCIELGRLHVDLGAVIKERLLRSHPSPPPVVMGGDFCMYNLHHTKKYNKTFRVYYADALGPTTGPYLHATDKGTKEQAREVYEKVYPDRKIIRIEEGTITYEY